MAARSPPLPLVWARGGFWQRSHSRDDAAAPPRIVFARTHLRFGSTRCGRCRWRGRPRRVGTQAGSARTPSPEEGCVSAAGPQTRPTAVRDERRRLEPAAADREVRDRDSTGIAEDAPEWSPDGRLIAFVRLGPTIGIAAADGSSVREIDLAAGETEGDRGRTGAGCPEDEHDALADIPFRDLLHDAGVVLAGDAPDATIRAVRQCDRNQLSLLRLNRRDGAVRQRADRRRVREADPGEDGRRGDRDGDERNELSPNQLTPPSRLNVRRVTLLTGASVCVAGVFSQATEVSTPMAAATTAAPTSAMNFFRTMTPPSLLNLMRVTLLTGVRSASRLRNIGDARFVYTNDG